MLEPTPDPWAALILLAIAWVLMLAHVDDNDDDDNQF